MTSENQNPGALYDSGDVMFVAKIVRKHMLQGQSVLYAYRKAHADIYDATLRNTGEVSVTLTRTTLRVVKGDLTMLDLRAIFDEIARRGVVRAGSLNPGYAYRRRLLQHLLREAPRQTNADFHKHIPLITRAFPGITAAVAWRMFNHVLHKQCN